MVLPVTDESRLRMRASSHTDEGGGEMSEGLYRRRPELKRLSADRFESRGGGGAAAARRRHPSVPRSTWSTYMAGLVNVNARDPRQTRP
jgi:hypothetical protein